MGRRRSSQTWTLLVLIQVVGVVTVLLPLWPIWTISALNHKDKDRNQKQEEIVLGESTNLVPVSLLLSFNETENRESFRMDKSPEERNKVVVVENKDEVKLGNDESVLNKESELLNTEYGEVSAMALASPAECHPVYSFDTVGPYRQEEAKTRAKERIYYYRETDANEEADSILTKDEFGLVCFTKMINCTVPPTATSVISRKTPNCVYFEKEFCTRKYGQMKWKGSVCPTSQLHEQLDYKCALRALGGSGGMEVAGQNGNGRNKSLNCKHSDALCLALKPPFYTRSGSSDRNPPTQTMCLCPLGYTGSACQTLDIDLFHLDLLHNIDLRNILLKYQQKDRYFIGVTLLFLLIVTLSSVLLVVAGCSFLFDYVQSRNKSSTPTTLATPGEIQYFSRDDDEDDNKSQHGNVDDVDIEINGGGGGGQEPPERRRNSRRNSSRSQSSKRRKSARLMTVMTITANEMTRALITRGQACLKRVRGGQDDEDGENEEYYDSDLELRFHRARMERRQRLSQRGRVSV